MVGFSFIFHNLGVLSLGTLDSLESPENGFSEKTPFPKDPFFPNTIFLGENQGIRSFEIKDCGAPIFSGISPNLLAALRGIHLYLSTPVLPCAHFAQQRSHKLLVIIFGFFEGGGSFGGVIS